MPYKTGLQERRTRAGAFPEAEMRPAGSRVAMDNPPRPPLFTIPAGTRHKALLGRRHAKFLCAHHRCGLGQKAIWLERDDAAAARCQWLCAPEAQTPSTIRRCKRDVRTGNNGPWVTRQAQSATIDRRLTWTTTLTLVPQQFHPPLLGLRS